MRSIHPMFYQLQTKLRAACLGVKIRAEKGLDNVLDSLSLFFARNRKRLQTVQTAPQVGAEFLPQPNSVTLAVVAETVAPQVSNAPAKRAVGHVGTGSMGGGTAPGARVSYGDGMSPRGGGKVVGGGGGGGVRVSEGEEGGEERLVLREMPNGLRVWRSSRAEEEAMFIFGEVFEDRTYARMGVRVQDGDTVWDVGKANDIGKAIGVCFHGRGYR